MICIESLRKYFTDESDITYRDLTFEDGKSYVLLGASGCGKSTLLHMISGVLSPTSGRILINGKDMAAAPQREKDAFRIAKIGYIFQDFKLIDEMTVQDNIDVLKLEKVDVSRTDELLERMGILKLKKRTVSRLSGGEKQRVAIARALVKQPEIILADE
ncbi:MAG: ATP-binding cassette domain-containing protein, partial [Clostridia bacterium]|nr:ATP-binding cassette domain-containing protein [Clostridia bacterium]